MSERISRPRATGSSRKTLTRGLVASPALRPASPDHLVRTATRSEFPAESSAWTSSWLPCCGPVNHVIGVCLGMQRTTESSWENQPRTDHGKMEHRGPSNAASGDRAERSISKAEGSARMRSRTFRKGSGVLWPVAPFGDAVQHEGRGLPGPPMPRCWWMRAAVPGGSGNRTTSGGVRPPPRGRSAIRPSRCRAVRPSDGSSPTRRVP